MKILILVGHSAEFDNKFNTLLKWIKKIHPSSNYTIGILYSRELEKPDLPQEAIDETIHTKSIIKLIKQLKDKKYNHAIILTGRTELNFKEFLLWILTKIAVSPNINIYPKNSLYIRLRREIKPKDAIISTAKYCAKATIIKSKIVLSCLGFFFWYCIGKIYKKFKKPRESVDILFIRQDAFGDIMMSYPGLYALRSTYPSKSIGIMTSSWGKPFFEFLNQCNNNKLYDRMIIWDAPWHDKKRRKLLGAREFIKTLIGTSYMWNLRFKTVIQPVGYGPTIAYAALLLGEKSYANIYPEYPMARIMSKFISNPIMLENTGETHIMDQVNTLLENLGVEVKLKFNSDKEKVLNIPEEIKRSLIEKIGLVASNNSHRKAAINIGAGSPERIIPLEILEFIISTIHKLGYIIFLIGAKEDRYIATKLKNKCKIPLVDLTGKLEIGELAALLEASDITITSDTGTMHLLALLNKRVIVIYGPGSITYSRPICEYVEIIKEELGCSGCGDNCCYSKDNIPPCLNILNRNIINRKIINVLKKKHRY